MWPTLVGQGPEHPRLHGENYTSKPSSINAAGTSPPTRGKLVGGQRVNAQRRNIPAYTGKTERSGAAVSRCAEHPRLHGENAVEWRALPLHDGTSPPTRGKLEAVNQAAVLVRNIPAYTGKTARWRCSTSGHPEHPRLHGENSSSTGTRTGSIGTSPPTRGKQSARRREGVYHRNIPAYTGKTSLLRRSSAACPEHPRLHGENTPVFAGWSVAGGTSPPTRGKPLGVGLFQAHERNIPAYTGKTQRH